MRPRMVEEDSAGVRVVKTLRPEWDDPLELVGDPVLRVPAADDPSATPLGAVQDAVLLPGGGLALLDRIQRRLVVYDPSGREVHSAGGGGQGPGQFEAVTSLWPAPDGGVEVYDARQGRLTEFGPDGAVRGVRTLPRGAFPRPPSRVWPLPDGRLLAWAYNVGDGQVVGRSPAGERWSISGALTAVEPERGAVDTLWVAPAWEMIRDGGRLWVGPFGPAASIAVSDGRILATTGASHTVELLDGAGGFAQRFTFPARDVPVDPAELGALEEAGRSESAERGMPFDAAVLFDRSLQPETRPAFDALRVDPRGTIWARRHEPFRSGPEAWWLIGAEGRYRGVVRLPDGCRLVGFGSDRLLVVRSDSLDVPTVEVWREPEAVRP